MPAVIPRIIREGVLESYLSGMFRHDNAIKHGVSNGTVSNIVSENKLKYGSESIERYRNLSLAISKSGLSIGKCEIGHRVEMVLRNMGVDDEDFEDFIKQLWELYREAGLSPTRIAEEVNELHFFRGQNQCLNGAISIPQIIENIESAKSEEMRQLQTNSLLRLEKDDLTKAVYKIRAQKEAIEAEFECETDFKRSLDVIEFRREGISALVDLAMIVKKYHYSIDEIAKRIAYTAESEDESVRIRNENLLLKLKNDGLLKENANLEDVLSRNSQNLRELEYLRDKGIGLKEFKLLSNLIDEIHRELVQDIGHHQEIPIENDAAFRKYLRDLEENYHDYLDLGEKVSERKSQLDNLESAYNMLLANLNLTKEAATLVRSLTKLGIKKDELEHVRQVIIENRLPQPKTLRIPSADHGPEYLSANNSKPDIQEENFNTAKMNSSLPKSDSNLDVDGSILTGPKKMVPNSMEESCDILEMTLDELHFHLNGNHSSCPRTKVSFRFREKEHYVTRSDRSKVLKRIRPPKLPRRLRDKRTTLSTAKFSSHQTRLSDADYARQQEGRSIRPKLDTGLGGLNLPPQSPIPTPWSNKIPKILKGGKYIVPNI